MKNQKLFFKFFFAVLLSVVVLGILATILISSESYLGVWSGILLLIIWAWVMLFPFGVFNFVKNFLKKNTMIHLIIISVIIIGVGCSKVPAGNVGVKVYLLGGQKGVDSEELGPGRYWVGINEDLFLFPTFTQNYVWTKSADEGSPNDESISFQTNEGLSVNADIGISYHIDPTKVSLVFQKYRKGVEEITDIYLRNMVRDALVTAGSTRPIESVYGTGKGELLADVEETVKAQCEPIGIVIEKISFIGDFRLPEIVTTAINAKIEATQKAQQRQNEIAETKAAADKLRAQAQGEADAIWTKAEAQAKANKLLAESITPELIQYESVKKWSGEMPYVTGTGGVPFINIPSPPPAER